MTGPGPFAASTSLDARRRARELAALADGERVDLLVVGGGVTGVGVALDAASRGLTVALAEARDLAFGTSRWSSKLVHGGLRYLAHGDVAVAWESAVERDILMRSTAPHLVRALPIVTPLTPAVSPPSAAVVRAGLQVGDVLRRAAGTPRAVLPAPRRLTAVETLGLAPALGETGLRGGLVYWDGQLVDDARLVVALARTAAGFGARILTRLRVTGIEPAGSAVGPGRSWSRQGGFVVAARDVLGGGDVEIRARAVINATGVWAPALAPGIRLRPSRGTHLVVRSEAFAGGRGALSVPIPGERGRFALVLPQGDGRVYVGLTDVPVDRITDVPEPDEAEITQLIEIVSTVLAAPLDRADVVGTFAGLRPLLDDEHHADGEHLGGGGRAGSAGAARSGRHTADLSRRHLVHTGDDGLVTVVGGKLTTYRRMAADAVDAAVAAAGLPAGPCRTRHLGLVGAAPRARLAAIAAARRLVERYGTEAPRVLALADGEPGLLAPVAAGVPVTGAEWLFAVCHEGALDPADLLDRRSRIGLVPAERRAALAAATRLFDHAASL
ncbi:Glycerol-3-phosphate dehydrogenase 1 [Frankia canadensis]|uniref:Glycerol-3-phosphate dehydrogenase n=1 Tax=Frankia canadensis TaxID=1836972 RepID=A0A2I2KP97_9ACTN|nr:glycerol-3-phosphate dehydrogenase/oxidase [Frankia canadensis]SNQ47497.1 Glycerol-3-phosphate dehydrogenase 1 [Frankia canadensis]SOU54787.1 Glycerol-3-phosphate dehydrogenase 1 [Frankia canadensis]